MSLRQVSLVASLMRPVAKALAKTGLTQKELLSGPIEHTDLLWETPPLMCGAMLDGVPLHFMFESRVPYVVPNKLYEFWQNAMVLLRAQPYAVIKGGGWVGLAHVMPKSNAGDRAFWITTPRGFPDHIDDYAGVLLSLECAHLMRLSTPIKKLVESTNDYYVVMENDLEIGVRDGLPIIEYGQWDIPVDGMVMDLLRLPRGEPFNGCDYDLIAKLRSVAHRYKSKLSEYEGVDWALQVLRVLANGRLLPEVQKSIAAFRTEQVTRGHKVKALRDAIELANAFSISDRARVIAIRSLLVPEFMTLTKFQSTLFHADHPPAAMSAKTRDRLQKGLQAMLDEETTNA